MSGILQVKFKDPKEWRDCALLAKRYDAKEGVKAGIVDFIVEIGKDTLNGNGQDTKNAESEQAEQLFLNKSFEFSKKLKLGQLSSRSKHIYGLLKESLYDQVLQKYEHEKDRIIDMRDFLKIGKL